MRIRPFYFLYIYIVIPSDIVTHCGEGIPEKQDNMK